MNDQTTTVLCVLTTLAPDGPYDGTRHRRPTRAEREVSTMRPLKRLIVLALLMLATPAWAGTGWYLMLPPRDADNYYESKTANLPLSKWKRSKAFDSARECEEFVALLIRTKEDELEKVRREMKAAVGTAEENKEGGVFLSTFNYVVWLKAGRCVASDDLGLR